jgi:hypothetical protein
MLPTVLAALTILVSDALIVWLNVTERDAWAVGDIHRSMVIEGASALVVCVNVILISELHWLLVPFSIAGALAGRYAAWRW